jgi:hypothetical protein
MKLQTKIATTSSVIILIATLTVGCLYAQECLNAIGASQVQTCTSCTGYSQPDNTQCTNTVSACQSIPTCRPGYYPQFCYIIQSGGNFQYCGCNCSIETDTGYCAQGACHVLTSTYGPTHWNNLILNYACN